MMTILEKSSYRIGDLKNLMLKCGGFSSLVIWFCSKIEASTKLGNDDTWTLFQFYHS